MSTKTKTLDLVYIAMFAVIITICSWIAIPTTIPFTLQTFGVFLTLGMLGGKRGTFSVFIYILLGVIGIPVFAEFTGGLGIVLGPSGGYIIGFLFTALVMWGMEKIGDKKWVLPLSMVIGLIVCYAFGTVWFMIVYSKTTEAIGLWTALMWCVIPFILPDAIKISLAVILCNRLKKVIKK
ncbi:MAG: biotin transporter BioY [Clostridiales bacterium]|nr:biotin transporter BioY [Clostridiales bacterium]